MKVELLTHDREDEYDKFLKSREDSLFNASLIHRDFIRTLCPNALPYYFTAINDQNKIVGVLPSFILKGKIGPVLNSLPWYGSNPGVVADSQEAFYMLLQAFDNTARWTGCFSSTIISPPNQDQDNYEYYFNAQNVFCDDRNGLITKLPKFNDHQQFASDLLKKIHQKTRNQIIKATQNCQVYESYGNDDWQFLINTHRENMNSVGGVPKKNEFDIIKNHFKKGDDYRLYVAFTDDGKAERCGALLVEYFNKTVEYIVPAVKLEHRALNPMNILIFSAMGDAAQKGYKYWNWGGTKLPSQGGVYHFKKRFGASESEYKYYTRVYGYLSFDVTQKWLRENYPYFYVLPYSLLDNDVD